MQVVALVTGARGRPTTMETQYRNTRRLLLAAVGAAGDCIASEDADFECRAKSILALPG
jgi:hypothetical protein